MPTRRSVLAALSVPVLGTGPASAQGATPAAGILRVTSPWAFDNPDPIETGYVVRRLGIAETLVEVAADGNLVPGVAERWAVDADRLTWRFTLRDGVFHDGTPLTARTVAAGLRRVWDKAETLATIPLAALEPLDDRTLLIRTRTPFAPLPAFLTDYAGIVLAPAAYDGADVARVVATGPYRITALGGAQTIDAEATAPGPAVRAFRYTAATLGEARATLLESGAADLAFTLLPQSAERIEAARRGTVLHATIPRVRMVAMNLALPQFADVRVRRALSLAIDRPGIARAILRDPASAATQLLPPVLAGWHDPALPPLLFDPAAARALLEDAGWHPGPDGVRTRDGIRLAAAMLVPGNRPELPPTAEAIQAQWKAVGAALSIQVGPSAAQPAAVRAGTLQSALLARTYVNVPDPIGTMLPDFAQGPGSTSPPIWASPGYDSAEMRNLVAQYVAAFDTAPQAGLRRRIASVLQRDLPVIPVSWFEHNAAVGPRLRPDSVVLDPFEQRYGIAGMRWAA